MCNSGGRRVLGWAEFGMCPESGGSLVCRVLPSARRFLRPSELSSWEWRVAGLGAKDLVHWGSRLPLRNKAASFVFLGP